jgi:hypothetical protein
VPLGADLRDLHFPLGKDYTKESNLSLVLQNHPVIVGPGIMGADHLQARFEGDAADGF